MSEGFWIERRDEYTCGRCGCLMETLGMRPLMKRQHRCHRCGVTIEVSVEGQHAPIVARDEVSSASA